MSRTIAVVMFLALPAASLAQVAGDANSMRQHLSSRKAMALAIKSPEKPGAPRVFPTTGVAAIAFSPDGKWIATSDNLQSVYLWDRDTGKAKWVLDGHHRWISRLEFSADSTHLLASQGADTLHRATHGQELSVWKCETGELVRCHQPSDWALSKDGKSLAVGRANRDEEREGKLGDVIVFKGSTIDICNFPSHKIRCSITLPGKFVHALALSPDGRILAVGSRNEILFWDTATGDSLPSITGLKERVHVLKYSPDGKTLASVSDDLIPSRADVVDAPGALIKRAVELWDVKKRKKTAVLNAEAYWYFTSVNWIDDKSLVAGRYLHDFDIWNLDQRKVTRTLEGVVTVFDGGKKLAHNQNERDRHGSAFYFEDLVKK